MPLLETASVNLGHQNEEYCDFCDNGGSEDCDCGMVYLEDDCAPDVSVHLLGLSTATCLELIASSKMKPKSDMELDGSGLMEESLTLKKLKIVEIKCQMIDERVHNIFRILSDSSISLEKINVQKL
ncbi:hypothetical protein QYE76_064363 [Lolium multiflorum]|uniref:Uncharacterized protein n=1 Tax=Lolium multiflorum TaxID=4521 RepID=A0AAD8S866_LOLMU|nr:hypothetical protein QYE76_064363 [Lolium multiflorum]